MTDVYFDASVVAARGAADQLAHLVDAGQRVVLVGPTTGQPALPGVTTIDRLPDSPDRGSWFVTADPARCTERQAGFRTLLVGPRAGRPPLRGPRCDTDARDLGAAVLTILAHDAMGS